MTIALQNLEKTVGVALLVRHPKGVRLTGAGERFLQYAQQVANLVNHAVVAAQTEPVQIKGEVRVGITDTISAYLMPSLISSISERFMNFQLKIAELDWKTIEEQLFEEKLDIGMLPLSNVTLSNELRSETIIRSPRRLWTPPDHPLQESKRVTLEDVAREDFLLLDMDEHVPTFRKYWEKYHLRPNVKMQSKSIEAVRSLVALGEGVTILSDLVYRPWSLEGKRISRRELSVPIPTMDVGVVWRSGNTLSPPAKAFIDTLRAWKRTNAF
jgi:DNA-binding transcriptional LysR family regulator